MNKACLILGVPLLLSILLSVYVRIDTETSHPRAISYAGIMKAASLAVSTAQAAESPDTATIELDWDALIPADWRPNKLLSEYNADNLSDDDPRAQELMDKNYSIHYHVWDQGSFKELLNYLAANFDDWHFKIVGEMATVKDEFIFVLEKR